MKSKMNKFSNVFKTVSKFSVASLLVATAAGSAAHAQLASSCLELKPVQMAPKAPINFMITCPNVSEINIVTKSSKAGEKNLTKLVELGNSPGKWMGQVPVQFFKPGENVQFIVIFTPTDNTGIVQESIKYKTQ